MDALINILLVAAFVGSLIWVMVAPPVVAIIPTFSAIASGIGLVRRNTDWIKTY